VEEAGKRQFCRARAASDRRFGLDDMNFSPRARERDCRRETIWSRAYDDRVQHISKSRCRRELRLAIRDFPARSLRANKSNRAIRLTIPARLELAAVGVRFKMPRNTAPITSKITHMKTQTSSTRKTTLSVIAIGTMIGAFAFAQEHKEMAKPEKAIAVLQPTEGSKVKGTITFTKGSDGVRVEGEITGLAPGKHGFHIHEFGDTSSADGKAAGAHFNPTGEKHGAPDGEHRHVGDFGNIEAGTDGAAKVNFLDKQIALEGEKSILGRGLVVHAKADDLKSQPSGEAGDRVAVGVIGVTKGK
jgi:Cu-Zn family superoxide dismutase